MVGMTLLTEFEVIGLPAPQGSKSAVVIGGKARIIEGKTSGQRAKHKAWRDVVASTAHDLAPPVPFSGPLEVLVEFRLPRPASRSKKHHGWHTVAPDKDKLLRATLDGLQVGGLVANDAMFAAGSWTAREVDGWTGAVITIHALGEAVGRVR